MAYIEPQNRLYRMVKWALSESETDFSGLRYGVYEKPICPEPASDIPNLTSTHISFAKIFCQNLVKKNCKLVFKFFHENDVISREKRCRKSVTVMNLKE